MSIRPAELADENAITQLYNAAFSKEEGPVVGKLAIDFLTSKRMGDQLSLVWEHKTKILGHIAFSSASVRSPIGINASILAPLAVDPASHGNGIGSALVYHGLQVLADQGCNAVFVYGDPDYYKRFGFEADLGTLFIPPYPLSHPFGWQAVMLAGTNPPETAIEFDCIEPLNKPELW